MYPARKVHNVSLYKNYYEEYYLGSKYVDMNTQFYTSNFYKLINSSLSYLVGAKEALGTALYSSGYFERALIQFHKMNRLRQSNTYDDWIGRCEETIKAFLVASEIEVSIVEGMSHITIE